MTFLSRAAFVTCASLACVPGGDGNGNDETDSETHGHAGWLDFHDGCTIEPWTSIDRHEITMVLGGQGFLMIPLPIRVGGIEIDTSIRDWDDPRLPKLNLAMRVDGFSYGVDDTFIRIANYGIRFEPIPGEDAYEFVYVTLFPPDEICPTEDTCEFLIPQDVDGLTARIEASLRAPGYGIEGGSPVEYSAEVTLRARDPLDEDDSCAVD